MVRRVVGVFGYACKVAVRIGGVLRYGVFEVEEAVVFIIIKRAFVVQSVVVERTSGYEYAVRGSDVHESAVVAYGAVYRYRASGFLEVARLSLAVGSQPRVSAAGPVGSRGERQVFERVFLCYGSEVLRVVNDMYGRAVAADERIAVVGVEEYGSAGCKQRSLARGRVDFEKACPGGIYVGAEGAHFLVIPRSCGGPVRRVEQVVVGVAHKHSLCCGGVYFAAGKGACVYRRFELVCVAELSAFDVHYRHSCVCGQVCV